MLELLLVILILAGLVGASSLIPLVTWTIALIIGVSLISIGLLIGIPTGLIYHFKLYAVLAPRHALPARWWLRPNAFHNELHVRDRTRVMPWFYAGAVGFVVTILGCAVTVVALLISS